MRTKIARLLSKSLSTQQEWIVDFYKQNPVAFLDEAKKAFELRFKKYISVSSVWRIIHKFGFTWKILERRAMQDDVFRFFHELASINWSYHNIEFLDEVSFDSRGMLRKREYDIKGRKLCCRGEFDRKPRVSMLCFIDVNGMVQVFDAIGIFDRHKFFKSCAIHSKRCSIYPGKGSIWILDGASIHCHADIVYSLRSLGIIPIFLPAYCPFFNPIEYVFGLIKKAFRRHYKESETRDLMHFVMSIMKKFQNYDLFRIYHHCGYTRQGRFRHDKQLSGIHEAPSANELDNLLDFIDSDEQNETS
ncbi:Serine/threonine-protein Kinase rio2 [Aphanomyces euteiches]|nr:Serine/threonine-protein Kinase rio2 [Aphanomyces euteiches]